MMTWGLAPATPIAIELTDDLAPPRARVTVPADEVSMAIGRGGQNIRLASMLSGYVLDVYRDIKETEEDVDIDEFRDAIPPEIIQKLKDIGCDTAKAVLELQPAELARRTELTEVQAQKLHLLMEAEFTDEEADVDLHDDASGDADTSDADTPSDASAETASAETASGDDPESAASGDAETSAADEATPAPETSGEAATDGDAPDGDAPEAPEATADEEGAEPAA